MKLSVIIPVFNCEKYVGRCIDSVLGQQLDDGDEMQIIIIDDGSTDDSGEIVDRYAAHYGNIQVIHQSNQGVSIARNKGLDLAQGDYIHFVDSDDFLLYDNAYLSLFRLIKTSTTPIDILRINSISFFEGKTVKTKEYEHLDHVKVEFVGTGIEACSQMLFAGQIAFSLYSRELIEEINLRFDPTICISEDALFNLYLYRYARHVVITDASVYVYYRNAGSATFTNDKKRLKSNIDNLFSSLPATTNVLNLYEDSSFKTYRIGLLGEAIAKRLMMASLPLTQTREYIKKGYNQGLFPIYDLIDGKSYKMLNLALRSPTFFWFMSILFRNIYLKWIKPLRFENG